MPRADTEAARRRAKELRVTKREKAKSIETELEIIAKDLNAAFDSASKRIGVPASELSSIFYSQGSAKEEANPTAWNGLVHHWANDREWQKMKVDHPGPKYMAAVVRRIHEEGLYTNMTEEERAKYLQEATDLRNSRINAGTARSDQHRREQGPLRDKIPDMAEKLEHYNRIAGIESLLFVVSGCKDDGLHSIIYSSKKARTFMEDQMPISCDELLTRMEHYVQEGPAGLAKYYKDETQSTKAALRLALLASFREAATSEAADGSPALLQDPMIIHHLAYKNYISMARRYKVVIEGWPMNEDGSMKDPSTIGGLTVFRRYIKLIENKKVTFKRLTEEEFKEWDKDIEQQIDAGKFVLPMRNTRSDAGVPKKNKTNQTTASTNKARTVTSKHSTKDSGPAHARDHRANPAPPRVVSPAPTSEFESEHSTPPVSNSPEPSLPSLYAPIPAPDPIIHPFQSPPAVPSPPDLFSAVLPSTGPMLPSTAPIVSNNIPPPNSPTYLLQPVSLTSTNVAKLPSKRGRPRRDSNNSDSTTATTFRAARFKETHTPETWANRTPRTRRGSRAATPLGAQTVPSTPSQTMAISTPAGSSSLALGLTGLPTPHLHPDSFVLPDFSNNESPWDIGPLSASDAARLVNAPPPSDFEFVHSEFAPPSSNYGYSPFVSDNSSLYDA